MESNVFCDTVNETRISSPHGPQNYLYNIYDQWSDLCHELKIDDPFANEKLLENVYTSKVPEVKFAYSEKPMVENTSLYSMNACRSDSDSLKNQLLDLDNQRHALTNDGYCGKPMVENHAIPKVQRELPMVDGYSLDNKNPSNSEPVGNQASSSMHEDVSMVDTPVLKAAVSHIQLTKEENSKNFSDQNGFVYSLNNNRSKNFYFRCKSSAGHHKCPARAKAKNRILEQAELTIAHSHLPDEAVLQKTKFDGELESEIASNKFMSTRELYFKAREKVPVDKVQYLRPRSSYNSFIHRRKKQFKPKNPKTIEEFEELINSAQFKSRYCMDERNQTFYRGVWTDKNGNKMIVFVSESGLQVLKTLAVIEFLMDGTFKVLPRHIHFCQFYIMSFMYEERCYPFAFVFMEKRDTAAYDLLFENIVALITPECAAKVLICMSDYERAVRNMCRKHFPNARIAGCYFHYVKAIRKRARKSGLSKDPQFEQPVRELCALALLPNDFISPGFDVIVNKTHISAKWTRFQKYWHRNWLPANISVYGLRNRTDNFQESFNRSFNLLNGKPHQNIWIVLKNLKQMEMDKTDDLLRQKKGKMFKKRPDKLAEKMEEKIRQAIDRFNETQDVARFLENITYDEDIQKACMQNHLLEDGDDDHDDTESEEIIGNDFDVTANFQMMQKPVIIWKRKSDNNLNVEQAKKAKPIVSRKRKSDCNLNVQQAKKAKPIIISRKRKVDNNLNVQQKAKTGNERIALFSNFVENRM